MKNVIALLVLVVAAGALIGCACFDPCDPCVTSPVYASPCCPAPSGDVGGAWGAAPAMVPPPAGGGASCGACGG